MAFKGKHHRPKIATAEERGWSLHDYQIVARDYLRGRDRAGLFLDMGLGKTASSLSALEPRHLPALVVAPKRVAEEVWPTETALWRPDLQVSVAKGTKLQREVELIDSSDIVAISRDNIRDVLNTKGIQRFNTLILDELSSFRNRSSIRWKAARKIIKTHNIDHVWGLTGTPAPNGLLDLWGQVYLLDGGERLGKTLTAYRDRYFYPGRRLATGVIVEWLPHDTSEAAIHRKLEDLCLSMKTEGRIKLPPVTENHIQVELPTDVRRVYDQMNRHLVADLRDIFGGEIHTAANAAILSSKLSQITAGFMYVDEADIRGGEHIILHNEKPRAVEEIIEGTGGSPVLVFYRFKVEAEMLRKQLGDKVHDINEPGVIDAWNRGEIPVLIAHPASASHGLNLQYGGHTIVWTSLDWDLELWEQANKRLARQGQTHPVVIHVVMAKKSVDRVIRTSLDDKSVVQGNLLEHLESVV